MSVHISQHLAQWGISLISTADFFNNLFQLFKEPMVRCQSLIKCSFWAAECTASLVSCMHSLIYAVWCWANSSESCKHLKKWEYFDRYVGGFKRLLIHVRKLLSDLSPRSPLSKADLYPALNSLVPGAAHICCLFGTSSSPLGKLCSSSGTVGGGEGSKSKEALLDYSLF